MTGPAEGARIHRVFPGTTHEIAAARRWLARWLGEDHPAADTAVLLLSETFANSCAHSRSGRPGGTVEIGAELTDRTVRLQIIDGGGGPAALTPTAQDHEAENGRGLWLLDLLAKEWSSRPLPDGRLLLHFTVAF